MTVLKWPTRNLLLRIIESDHELARVLRYPRMLALHGLSDGRIYDCIGFLRAAREIVRPNPLPVTPIRDVNDTAVMQTAIIGEAEFLCTKDAFSCSTMDRFEFPGASRLVESAS